MDMERTKSHDRSTRLRNCSVVGSLCTHNHVAVLWEWPGCDKLVHCHFIPSSGLDPRHGVA